MRAIVSSLMAGLLFIQAVSGWCCQPLGASDSSTDHVGKCCSCCDRCCQDQQHQQPKTPSERKSECHGFCTYVVPQKSKVHTQATYTSVDIVVVPSTTTNLHPPGELQWEIGSGCLASRLPVRLHLYHQVLLI
jgi:hypothetical protein